MAKPIKQGSNLPPVSTQFKPGQSGNPGGMKKGARFLSTRLKELAEKVCKNPDHKHEVGISNEDCIALGIVRAAQGDFSRKGQPDMIAVKEYADRTEGPVAKLHKFAITPELEGTVQDLARRVLDQNADEDE